MTRLPLQRTRLNRVQEQAGRSLFASWVGGSWRHRSLAVLALFFGVYAGSNLTTFLLRFGSRPLVVLLLVLALEVLVRARTRLAPDPAPLGWVIVDNLRIGLVYAVVLESFKLGS